MDRVTRRALALLGLLLLILFLVARCIGPDARDADPAPPPAADPDPDINADWDQVDSTHGSFRVNEQGNATYTIPIFAPTGTAGVTPELAITYNSGQGMGLLGRGAAMSGLPAITRCRQTLFQDEKPAPITYTQEDRFCLDGQRLIVLEGYEYGEVAAHYRTETDAYVLITTLGGEPGSPNFFEVHGKDGSMRRFGANDADTRAKLYARNEDGSVTTNIYKWALSEIRDSASNAIAFFYQNDVDGQRIDTVRYAYAGASPWDEGGETAHNAIIQFTYQDSGYPHSAYVGGYRFHTNKRLSAIRVDNNEAISDIEGMVIVRQYNLEYEAPAFAEPYPKLSSVSECWGSICKQPTTFSWVDGRQGFDPLEEEISIAPQGDQDFDLRIVDINSDGLADFVWRTNDYDGNEIHDTYWRFMMQQSDGSWGSETQILHSMANPDAPLNWVVLDYNADGYLDVLLPNTATGNWVVFLGHESGLNLVAPIPLDLPFDPEKIDDGAQAADVDSDGLVDFVFHGGELLSRSVRFENTAEGIWETELGEAEDMGDLLPYFGPIQRTDGDFDVTSFELPSPFQMGDFNGDGIMDIVGNRVTALCADPGCREELSPRNTETIIVVGDGTGKFVIWDTLPRTLDIHRVADVSGDGLADLFLLDEEWYFYLSNGVAMKAVQDLSAITDSPKLQLVDHDNDGTLDLFYPRDRDVYFRLYDAATQGFEAESFTPMRLKNNDNLFQLADINGDASEDYVETSMSNLWTRDAYHASIQVSAIDNGLGMQTDISYLPLTDSSVYIRRADANALDWDLPLLTQSLGKYWKTDAQGDPVDGAIIDMIAPSYRVSAVSSTAPRADENTPGQVLPGSQSTIRYKYEGGRVQAAGRGTLGFARVTSIDDYSGVVTVTDYRQDFPFIGLPYTTTTQTAEEGGMTLSKDHTFWSLQDWSDQVGRLAAPYPVYENVTANYRHDLATGLEYAATEISRSIDSWGNVETTETVNFDTDLAGERRVVNTVSTDNQYTPASLPEELARRWGRLSRSEVTFSRPGQADVTRASAFDYYDVSESIKVGLLKDEWLNPGSAKQLHTGYLYSGLGNVTLVATVGDAGLEGAPEEQSRVARYVWGEFGRNKNIEYIQTGNEDLDIPPGGNQGEMLKFRVTQRSSSGNVVRSEDAFGRTVSNKLGFFERLQHTYDAVGTWTTISYSHYAGEAFCPAPTQVIRLSEFATGGYTRECIDALGRVARTMRNGFAPAQTITQDFEFDYRSNVQHESLPYFRETEASDIKWLNYRYDLLGRAVAVNYGDGSESTTAYSGNTTISTNDKGQQKIETRNAAGEIVHVIEETDVHLRMGYDAAGNLVTSTVGDSSSDGGPLATTVTMAYDSYGHKISMSDPDMGDWEYEYNAFSEMTRQTDARNQSTEIHYDVLGRRKHIRNYAWNGANVLHESEWTYDAFGSNQAPGMTIATYQQDYTYEGDIASDEFKLFLYDTFGRFEQYTVNINDGELQRPVNQTYDEHGRLFQKFGVTGGDYGEQYFYNEGGYLERIQEARYDDPAIRTTYKTILAMDAYGNVTSERLGGALGISRTHDRETARLTHIGGTIGATNDTQDMAFAYDTLGNLTSRADQLGDSGTLEGFCYDDLNRLVQTTVGNTTPDCSGIDHTNGDTRYNLLGNITFREGVGDYQYSGPQPHAVTQAGANAYTYDANGLMESGAGNNFQYTAYNMPSSIRRVSTNETNSFYYGIDRNRYKRINAVGGQSTTTWTVEGTETIHRPTGSRESRRYIGGNVVVIHQLDNDGNVISTETHYLLKDHLGSNVGIVDATSIADKLSYNVWGHRRDAADWSTLLPTYQPDFDDSVTNRGFTAHEHLDALGLIHMNGRIYDPHLGRFLQADPFIDGVTYTQGYNRYSYVANNPLSYVDPTGYFKLRELVGAVVGVALHVWAPWGTGIWQSFTYGAIAGGSGAGANGGNILQGAITGGVSAAAFSGVAGAFGEAGTATATATNTFRAGKALYLSGGNFAGLVAAQGMVGGIMAELQGGKFGHGFLSAGITKLATPGILSFDNVIAESVASGIVGGTVSEMTGGKFANGATTGAFLYAFNAGFSKAIGALQAASEARRVLKNARARGVSRAWKMEQDLVKTTGRGTREWTEAELGLLKAGKRVPGYNGHHINSAAANSIKMAENPSNIEFLTRAEHFARHGNNWQNVTQGALIDRALSIGVTVFGVMEIFDPVSITEQTQADMGNPYGIPTEM